MKHPAAALDTLGAQVARTQDEQLEHTDLFERTRPAVLARAGKSRSRESWILGGYAAAGGLAAAVVLLWLANRPLRVESLGFSQGADRVMTSGGNDGLLTFSDGSRVAVSPSGEVRIQETRRRGARLQLRQGALRADIVHERHTDWQFEAGPFRVAVVGTRFDLQWSPSEEALKVTVHEGAVRVSGCSLSGVPMGAGQSALLRCKSGHPLLDATPENQTATRQTSIAVPASSSSAPIPQVLQPQAGQEASLHGGAETDSADAGPQDWRALAAKGRLRDAYAAADAAGFEGECERAAPRELLELADGAGLAGRVDRSTAALMATRRRFPGSSASAAAAYRLGRIAFDQRGALGDARTWFRTYLQESPSGSLAREALGRLIEVELRSGNVASARTCAEQYLRQHPNGPHAELARRVIEP